MPTDVPAPPTVVLVDGSEVGWHALRFAARRAAETGGGIVCVAVTPPRLERGRAAHFDPESDQLDTAFADELLRRAGDLCAQASGFVALVRRIGIPVTALAAVAAERGADCIVIGRRPRLSGFALPDFAEQLGALAGISVHAVELPPRPLPVSARPPGAADAAAPAGPPATSVSSVRPASARPTGGPSAGPPAVRAANLATLPAERTS
jgi:nucleotide-binding universal stress UspA family protein